MPNAYNKVRTNQLLKLDKENENKVIRRKQRNGQVPGSGGGGVGIAYRGAASPPAEKQHVPISRRVERATATAVAAHPPPLEHDDVWERLTGLRKSPSNDSAAGQLGTTRSQMNMLLQRRSTHQLPPSLPLRLPHATHAFAVHKNAKGHAAKGGALLQSPRSAGAGGTRKSLSPCTAVGRARQQLPLMVATPEPPQRANRCVGGASAGRRTTHTCKRPMASGSFFMLCTNGKGGANGAGTGSGAGAKTMQQLLSARSICDSKTSSRTRSTRDSHDSRDSKDSSAKGSSKGSAEARSVSLSMSMSSPRDDEDDDDDVGDDDDGDGDGPQHWYEYSQDSADDYYETAPLIPVPTSDSLANEHSVSHRLRSVLQRRNKSMAPDELDTVKRVVKTDERHRDMRRDDAHLFRDILKTQLHEILRQELVVKSALCKLDSAADCTGTGTGIGIGVGIGSGGGEPAALETVHTIELQPSNTTTTTGTAMAGPGATTTSGSESDPQKPKVDVIFKNVPTLEKEILILKALGEQLEATLKRSAPECLDAGAAVASSTVRAAVAACERLKESGVQVAPTHSLRPLALPLPAAQWAAVCACGRGVRVACGVVLEFRIAHKTIVELKEQANKHFYLPVAGDAELRRTSFRRLKEKPDLLLQHLRSKSAAVSFNVLEQDPVFFNSIFLQRTGAGTGAGGPGGGAGAATATAQLTDATSEDSYDSSGGRSLSALCPPTDATDATGASNTPYPARSSEASAPPSGTSSSEMRGAHELRPQEGQMVMVAPPPPPPPPSTTETTTATIIDVPPEAASRVQLKCGKRSRRSSARHRSAKIVTPPPPDLVKAKESPLDQRERELLKTILVGVVQISVFLLMIVAVTYPDAKC